MYPNRSQYRNAVLNEMYPVEDNGGYSFSPVLIDNELVFASGGNATVFKLKDAEGKIQAVKFFTDEIAERFDRFEKISIFLKHNKFPFIVDFEFVKNLIFVPIEDQEEINIFFPGLIMKWIEAPTLESKIKDLITNNKANDILKIAKSFKDLSITILENNFSHGDLKLSNLLIDDNLKLYLIDYDGMFIKDFEGSPSFELGTPSYQHPKRTINDFDKSIDHFSILVIYASLIALAYYPDLYKKYNDGDNIILTLEDFNNPNKSELLKTLYSLKETKALAFYIKQSLLSESIYIDNLKDLLNGKFPKPTIEISHSPSTPLIGQKVKVSWKTNNVDFVKVNGSEQNVLGSIEEVVKIDNSLNFEYGNAIDSKKETYKFSSAPLPKIKEFRSKQQKIEHGKETQLVWDIENAEKVELHWLGNMEVVPNKGEKTISPTDHTNYKLIVTALDGITKEEKEITIQVFKRVEIKSFVSDLDFVVETLPVKLSWEIDNASSIILSSNMQTDIDVTGKNEIEILPKRTAVFYLKANNELFSVTSSQIKIEVQNIPTFNPSIIPRLPTGKDLIPSFDLDFKELSKTILNESQISFQTAMKPTKRFNILNSLQKILK